LITVFLVLIFGFVSAGDFYISDLVVPKLIYEDSNFSIDIQIANNFNTDQSIDLNIYFIAPDGNSIYQTNIPSISISANTVLSYPHQVIISDSNASNSPHLIMVTINNTDDNPTNNTTKKWVIVSKGQRKTPVPDMPIALGLVAGILVLFFISKKK